MDNRIKKTIKKIGKAILSKKPVYTQASIVQLAPSELLAGRCALITGGTSGIGYAIAEAFLNAGAKVIITSRNEERLQQAQQSLGHAKSCFGFVMDNTDVSSFSETFSTMRNIMGGG